MLLLMVRLNPLWCIWLIRRYRFCKVHFLQKDVEKTCSIGLQVGKKAGSGEAITVNKKTFGVNMPE
ncbi:hypothetical protein J2T12_000891 [Paenibacillus anaericanus]|nr:hypothetical protein [Paenibacillus anaericanus]